MVVLHFNTFRVSLHAKLAEVEPPAPQVSSESRPCQKRYASSHFRSDLNLISTVAKVSLHVFPSWIISSGRSWLSSVAHRFNSISQKHLLWPSPICSNRLLAAKEDNTKFEFLPLYAFTLIVSRANPNYSSASTQVQDRTQTMTTSYKTPRLVTVLVQLHSKYVVL